jgi:hypothetical protein
MSIPTEPTITTTSPTTGPATVPVVPATVPVVPPTVPVVPATVPVVPVVPATPTAAQLSLDQTIVEPGIIITNQQGQTADGTGVTHTTFTTTDPTFDPQITENLLETVDIKNASYDDTSSAVLAENVRV